jgi:hypothetical protein
MMHTRKGIIENSPPLFSDGELVSLLRGFFSYGSVYVMINCAGLLELFPLRNFM